MALVIFVARQQPLPPRLAMLHLTDCELPCWIGITPGVTPADQVKARIEEVYDPKIYRIEEDQGADTLGISRIDVPGSPPQITVYWTANPQGLVDFLTI